MITVRWISTTLAMRGARPVRCECPESELLPTLQHHYRDRGIKSMGVELFRHPMSGTGTIVLWGGEQIIAVGTIELSPDLLRKSTRRVTAA